MFLPDGRYVSSRSAIVARRDCGRLRLLGTDYNGLGYQVIAGSVPLLSGDHLHRLFARLLGHFSGLLQLTVRHDPIAVALELTYAEYTEEITESGIRDLDDAEVQFTIREQLTMLEGLARGWVKYRLPHILALYDVVEIEKEWLWELGPGILIPLRLDAVLRRKDDGLLYIMDYKGAAYIDDAWQRIHEQSTQTMLYLEALAERTGEPIGGIFYEGLVRGAWKKDTAESSPWSGRKIQQSPLCYGYRGPTKDGTIDYQSGYTNRKGWAKFRVADHMPLMAWLEVLEREGKLKEMFITMEPASPAPELRGSIRQEVLLEEQRYIEGLREFNQLQESHGIDDPITITHLALIAGRNTERCYKYGSGSRCQFLDVGCLSPGMGLEALPVDDQFKPRVPHHDVTKLIIPLRKVA